RRELRATVIGDLGAWGDRAVIDEATRLFRGYVANRSSLIAEQLSAVLNVVGVNADRATFDTLRSLAKTARSSDEAQRFYVALASTRDPDLARDALDLALSPDIPPQLVRLRRTMLGTVAQRNPAIAWKFFQAHVDRFYGSETAEGRTVALAALPRTFWDAGALDQVVAWTRAHVPREAARYVDRAAARAREEAAIKTELASSTDAFLAQHPEPPATPSLPSQ
ncbi:MAG: ERAP1-like C-terminal domain-containing protein, partial [Candidatus Eremiobacteraeota bacterium]|nr:ERAP1-like C-terminal domain-containing protein [Candidatus Eremiobacteraeota bacterium]